MQNEKAPQFLQLAHEKIIGNERPARFEHLLFAYRTFVSKILYFFNTAYMRPFVFLDCRVLFIILSVFIFSKYIYPIFIHVKSIAALRSEKNCS